MNRCSAQIQAVNQRHPPFRGFHPNPLLLSGLEAEGSYKFVKEAEGHIGVRGQIFQTS